MGAVATMIRASALHVLAGLRRGEVVMVVVEFVMVIVELVVVIVIVELVVVIVIVSVVVVGMMGCILISLSSPCFRPVGSSVSLLRRRVVIVEVMVAAAVVMSAAVAVVLPFSVYLVRGFGLGLGRRRNSHSPGVFADG